MMNIKDAQEFLKKLHGITAFEDASDDLERNYMDAIQTALSSLRKAEAQSPIVINGFSGKSRLCPSCEGNIDYINDTHRYCSRCGQKINLQST